MEILKFAVSLLWPLALAVLVVHVLTERSNVRELRAIRRHRAQLAKLQTHLTRTEKNTMDKFDVLLAEVSELTTVTKGAIALIDSLSDQLDDAKDDPEQIAEIVATLRENRQALADAITANTPAAEDSGDTEGTEEGSADE